MQHHSAQNTDERVVRPSRLSFSDSDNKDTEIVRFVPPHSADEAKKRVPPDREYSGGNSLVRKVRIYNWQTKYSFRDRFSDDAVRLFNAKGSECPKVAFFSYSPQYAQMNRAQLSWYLWWRDNFRHGKFIDTDYSYVLLYVYEIINLSEKLDKQYCLDRLCDVWNAYGDTYEFIKRYLCEWICDFCLIHHLPPPAGKLKEHYPFILKNALLKEFYIFGTGTSGISADTLMALCSSYDYKKSKYATPERVEVMESYMNGVLERVIKDNSDKESPLSGFGFSDSSVTRTSYTGAFCSAGIKRKIEVEYCSFSRSHELRYLVADILRYTENKLRSVWGIRSRLSIYALPTHVKRCVDEYFEENPLRRAEGTDRNGNVPVNEYDKLYDLPSKPFSADNAAKIEENSWNTTRILVEAFDGEERPVEVPQIINEVIAAPEPENDLKKAMGERYGFLLAVLHGDKTAQKQETSKLSILPEALVDEINEIAAEITGDILIEDDGDGNYRIIEEYTDVISEV